MYKKKMWNSITMFIWRECASINVNVGVDLDRRDSNSTCFEYRAHAAGNYSFPNPTDHTSSY